MTLIRRPCILARIPIIGSIEWGTRLAVVNVTTLLTDEPIGAHRALKNTFPGGQRSVRAG